MSPAGAMHPARAVVPVLVAFVLLALWGGPAAAADRDRSLVSGSQLSVRPFRGVVLISVGDRVVCSGFVMAERKVATAAHCLTRDAEGGDFRLRSSIPRSIRLYRSYSQQTGGVSFPTCGVTKAWAHPRFVRSGGSDDRFGSHAHDYAVLTTTPGCAYPDGAHLPLWGTTLLGGQLPVGSSIAMAGYPSDARFSGMTGLNLWHTRGQVEASFGDSQRLFVTGFVGHGMSGAPVWRSFDSASPCGRRQCVVAMVTECAVNSRRQCKLGDSIRRAIRITPAVRKTLRAH